MAIQYKDYIHADHRVLEVPAHHYVPYEEILHFLSYMKEEGNDKAYGGWTCILSHLIAMCSRL